VSEEPERLTGWRREAQLPRQLDDCCLVVPTYQRPQETLSLLERLTEIRDAPGEVVIVDGSPNDSTVEQLEGWSAGRPLPFDLTYVRSPAGLTRQRNVGIDVSTRAFVFFLDDDCLPEPGYFEAIRRVFQADRAQVVGAVSGSIINEIGRPMSRRWRVRLLLGLVPRHVEPGRYYLTATSVPYSLASPFSGVREVDIVPGGASAYRRDVFSSNRFSLFFDGYAQGEDVEMSLRIGKAWRLLWCGEAHVNHFHATAGRPAAFQKGRMEVRNRFFIWKRYSETAALSIKIRFWSDIAYVFSYDLISFAARPGQPAYLQHALGVAHAAAECILSPPRYEEPPAMREYELDVARSRDA
jgi:GT2 family glycosyltransferase